MKNPTTAEITALEADAGLRLDVLLAKRLSGITRSAAQRLIELRLVTGPGGVTAKKNAKISAGERFIIELPAPEPTSAEAQAIPLDIVFEDADVIVINKQRGMVVHPAPGHRGGTLVNALIYHCGESLSGIGGKLRPGIVHRIDRDTSGLIIAAKNDFSHGRLAAQLSDHTLARVYEAIIKGAPPTDSGTVDANLARHKTDRKRQAVPAVGGRRAVTHYEIIARYAGFTHMRFRLETGRTHQIRAHMAHTGHPILGDEAYGGRDARFPELRVAPISSRPESARTITAPREAGREAPRQGQCLHARALAFVHPRTGELISLETPLPEYFTATLRRIESL
ncbi:MAG: RluA family pseudouridine synthase [Oscillospiraceae bacterium]|nr:RluA family pseudouridine synthase [Oscillospiraceae bacterium]